MKKIKIMKIIIEYKEYRFNNKKWWRKKLSGFFPTKTIYSELFFIDKLWLDIDMYVLEIYY